MANKIILKKSSVIGKIPQVSDLEYGELALNYADKRLYFKTSDNLIESFVAGAGGTGGAVLLNDLTDVVISSPLESGQILKYDGTTWINSADTNVSNQLVNGTKAVTLNADGTLSLTNPGALFDDSKVYTDTAPSQIIDTFDKGTYRTAKYLIQATSGNDVHSTEVLLTHNDENVFITEYAITFSTDSLISIDAIVDANNVSLVVTPTYNDTKIDFVRTSLVARALTVSETIEGDLMLLSGSIDLMQGDGVEDLNASTTTTLEGDLSTSSGTEDLEGGTGTVDLMV